MKKILVPIDYSEISLNALDYAVELADKMGSSLILCYVVYVPTTSTGMLISTVKKIREEAEVQIAAIAKRLADKLAADGKPAIQIQTEVTQGGIVEKILKVAEDEEADLIVMGTLGSSGIQTKILGSNTANVISGSKLPVLGIPAGYKFREVIDIVYASDWSAADRQAVKQLEAFARIFDAMIHVVHVVAEGEYYEPIMIENLKTDFLDGVKHEKIEFYTQRGADATSGLNAFLKDHPCDCLAMLKLQRGFFENLFHTSMTRQMVMHTQIPLLTFSE